MDNTGGALVKTAGYPGGVSAATPFGTAVFRAKKSGTAVIRVKDTSLALDAANQNVLRIASMPTVVVTVAARAVAPIGPAPIQPVTLPVSPIGPGPEVPAQPNQPISEPSASPSFLAAVGSVITLGTGNGWVGVLSVIILALIIFGIYSAVKRKSGS